MRARIGVIGGGLGGLSAAVVLAARGHDVVVLERNAWLGGKAAVLEEAGYRFDMGPTILTMPSALARVFAEAGVALRDRLELVPLDPQWRCFFDGRPALDLTGDEPEMIRRCEEFAPGAGAGYRDFLAFARSMRTISDRFFFWRSVDGVRDLLGAPGVGWGELAAAVARTKPGRSLAGVIEGRVADRSVAQVLEHYTQYVGSSPRTAPAVLAGIAAIQADEGVWYPRGGIGAVAAALERLARELGVEFRTGVGVQRILLEGGRVRGVLTDGGEREEFGAVVSNMDSVRTYHELIGGRAAQRFRDRHREPACSGVVLYLGLDRRYGQLHHHNFVFSEDPAAELRAVYERGEPAADPTCYVCAPARTDPEVAPPGGEALYVLVHAPYLRPHHDWAAMLPAYRRVILEKLERTAGLTGLERAIRFERHLTPADIHARYSVLNGAIYGLASRGTVLGALKPGNRRADVPGLYLAGGSAHPGPGVPMVVMSGWIAADALDRDGVAASATQSRAKLAAGASAQP